MNCILSESADMIPSDAITADAPTAIPSVGINGIRRTIPATSKPRQRTKRKPGLEACIRDVCTDVLPQHPESGMFLAELDADVAKLGGYTRRWDIALSMVVVLIVSSEEGKAEKINNHSAFQRVRAHQQNHNRRLRLPEGHKDRPTDKWIAERQQIATIWYLK